MTLYEYFRPFVLLAVGYALCELRHRAKRKREA